MVSSDPDIQKYVEKAGATFLDKAKVDPGFVEATLKQLVEQ